MNLLNLITTVTPNCLTVCREFVLVLYFPYVADIRKLKYLRKCTGICPRISSSVSDGCPLIPKCGVQNSVCLLVRLQTVTLPVSFVKICAM